MTLDLHGEGAVDQIVLTVELPFPATTTTTTTTAPTAPAAPGSLVDRGHRQR